MPPAQAKRVPLYLAFFVAVVAVLFRSATDWIG